MEEKGIGDILMFKVYSKNNYFKNGHENHMIILK